MLRHQLYLCALLVSVLALIGGCQPQETRNDALDPLVYAGSVKSRVVNYLERVKKTPAKGVEQTGYLIELLESYTKAPVGDSEAIYRDLLAGCQELNTMFKSGQTQQAKVKIEEVIKLAKTLPGNLNPGAYN